MLPRQREQRLRLRRLSGERDHQLKLGNDQTELPRGAIRPVSEGGSPELEAVARLPVRPAVLVRVDVCARGLAHPLGGEELPVAPAPLLHVELTERGGGLCRGMQSAVADLAAGGVALPGHLADTEWIEQARAEVVDQRVTTDPLDDRGGREGAGLVVGEDAPGLLLGREEEEAADHVYRIDRADPVYRLGGVAAGHREDMTDTDRARA